MNSKAVIAIVAVVIIIAGGVAAFLVMNGGGGSSPEKKDVLRTDLVVGDDIDVSVQISTKYTNDMERYEILGSLYMDSEYLFDTGKQKEVVYKGETIICKIYKYYDGGQLGYYLDEKGVVYGSYTDLDELKTETLLADTSFDLKKSATEQEIKEGDFIKSYTAELSMTSEVTIGKYNKETETWSVSTEATSAKPLFESLKSTIVKIEGDELTVKDTMTESESKSTKVEFLSVISYSNLLKSLDKYNLGKKTTEKIETPYGSRDVTVQTITYGDKGTETTVVAYHIDDLVYQMSTASGSSTTLIKINSSSLITPANA